jgi:hypothetical protein
MSELTAFHGDQAIKDRYLARVKSHMEADRLIRGTGWDLKGDVYRGCAIGCTLEAYDHSRYPIELGIPEWLAHLEDELFENMSEEKSRTWPHDFLSAITPGDDLDRVQAPFMIIVLNIALGMFDHAEYPDVEKSVRTVIALWQSADAGHAEHLSEAVWPGWAPTSNLASLPDFTAPYAASYAAAYASSDQVHAVAEATRSAGGYDDDRVSTMDYFADELIKILKKGETAE